MNLTPIPASTPPEDDRSIWIHSEHGWRCGFYYHQGDGFRTTEGHCLEGVTHWIERLPTPGEIEAVNENSVIDRAIDILDTGEGYNEWRTEEHELIRKLGEHLEAMGSKPALRKRIRDLENQIAASVALLEQGRKENAILLKHLRDMTTLAAAETSTKNTFRIKMIDEVDEFLNSRIPNPAGDRESTGEEKLVACKALENYNQQEINEYEELVKRCIEIMRTDGRASTLLFQRRLRLGYIRAAKICDILVERGYIEDGEGAKPRKILILPPVEEERCSECGEPLKDDFGGYRACFCRWGGEKPTVGQIIEAADAAKEGK